MTIDDALGRTPRAYAEVLKAKAAEFRRLAGQARERTVLYELVELANLYEKMARDLETRK